MAAMSLFKTKTPEEKAADEARKQAEREQRAYRQWLNSPPGQARLSYQRGDLVFQAVMNLAEQRGEIVPMVGGSISTSSNDPSSVLNAICAEGWDLITGTVVFVPTGQESRDKFMASGQQVAVSGSTLGYYLFRRRG